MLDLNVCQTALRVKKSFLRPYDRDVTLFSWLFYGSSLHFAITYEYVHTNQLYYSVWSDWPQLGIIVSVTGEHSSS